MSKLQQLTFSINLLDRVSGPVGKIQRKLGQVAKSAQDAFTQIGTGALGVAGAGFGVQQLVQPALDFSRAVGDVKSLDVADGALKSLQRTALGFSVKYGMAAADFVSSSYDIQSAINGLQGDELARFTAASNLLAKGTKSDAATITDYVGTMYGVFKGQADAMGKAEWVDRLTGKTAAAVQMFKTDGGKWAQAWAGLGANATAAGVSMDEQMAVLGKLQTTMGGGEAATKYRAFLQGVGNAQDKLNLKFTDANGNMLGMVPILEKLRAKFGDTLDVAESDALKEAFGSDEAVSLVKLLMADTGGLGKSIEALSKITGKQNAEWMAMQRTDPWQRFAQGINAVRIGLGQALLPVLNPLINGLANAAAKLTEWTQTFPTVTRVVGFGVLAVLGLTAALGALAIAGGLIKMGLLGWAAATKIAAGVQWILNASLWGCPIMIVVAGIAALSIIVIALASAWGDMVAAFKDSSWGKAIMKVLGGVLDAFKMLGSVFAWVGEKIGFGNGNVVDTPGGEAMGQGFGSWATVAPGVSAASGAASAQSPSIEAPGMLSAPRQAAVAGGGVTQHIARTVSNNNANSRTIGQVNVTTTKELDARTLSEEAFMAM